MGRIDLEPLTDEDRRKLGPSPGFMIAREVADIVDGTTKKLNDDDVKVAALVLSPVLQSATKIPSPIWKFLLLRILKYIHPGILNIVCILVAMSVPYFLYINISRIVELVKSINFLKFINYINNLLV